MIQYHKHLLSFNGPLHSNWAGLSELMSQLITSKQLVQLTTQTTLLEKTLRRF